MLTPTGAVRSGEASPPPATLADVARAAGLSCATVSRALNGGRASESTVERARRAASSLGYRPSYIGRMLSSRRTESVAAVVASLDRFALVQALQSFQREMAVAGTSVTIVDLSVLRGDGADAGLLLRDRDRFDGVALLGVGRHDRLASVIGALPQVMFGELETARIIDPVAVATDHLRALGHDHMLYVGVDGALPDRTDYDAARRAGFEEAAADDGWRAAIGDAQPSVEGGYSFAVRALGSVAQRPTAVIAGTGEIATGVMLAAQRLGLDVPADLSIVAVEDHPSASLRGLTSVDVRASARGAAIAHRLTGEITGSRQGSTAAEDSEQHPILRVRHSTGIARRSFDERK